MPTAAARASSAERRVDHVSAGRRLVLVVDVPRRRLRLRELLLRLFGRELGVEQVQDDLAADRATELGEHPLALLRVLDKRILLRHRAEMDALPQDLHVLEMLAPADVDDLEDDEPLELAHEVRPNSSSFASYSSPRVALELLDQRLAARSRRGPPAARPR